MKTLKSIYFILISSLIIFSCQSVKTALFDQYSYQQTTAIKVEASNVMDKATTPFSNNKEAVEKLLLDVDKLVEYEKNKPNNEITFAMWKILSDKEKNLLAGFFKRWEEKGSFSPVFLQEAKKQVTDALDLLIQYEVKKDKQSKDNLVDLINLNK
ncbi:hypothetical protein [Flavobacterium sp.]|uniref:hypothetical protein n=1 Tax=Flavobacterium sp. TaxID=239 RepID=UPI00286D3D9F|nr:hypothetical protein [Flavobacterium sp.]